MLGLSTLLFLSLLASPASPAPTPEPELGIASVRASSTLSKGKRRFPPKYAIDGDPGTAWRPKPKTRPWIELNFGRRVEIHRCSFRAIAQPRDPRVPPAPPAHLAMILPKLPPVDLAFDPTAGKWVDVDLPAVVAQTARLKVVSGLFASELAISEFTCRGIHHDEPEPESSEETTDPDSGPQPHDTTCDGKDCQMFVNCPEERLLFEFEKDREPAIIQHPTGLTQYLESCGSPCSYSVFVRCPKEQVSDPLWIPIAIDPERDYLVHAEKGHLVVRSIFSEDVIKRIARVGFQQTVELSMIVKARFNPDGSLTIWYPDLRSHEVVETIPLDPP